ncbi:hypothetical protein SBA2_10052 [Acidobacteriia bacterium SbA2]|nr:hypothetical protein SBA2_10052 [Acidobacteriia bacterium SbA2]
MITFGVRKPAEGDYDGECTTLPYLCLPGRFVSYLLLGIIWRVTRNTSGWRCASRHYTGP